MILVLRGPQSDEPRLSDIRSYANTDEGEAKHPEQWVAARPEVHHNGCLLELPDSLFLRDDELTRIRIFLPIVHVTLFHLLVLEILVTLFLSLYHGPTRRTSLQYI